MLNTCSDPFMNTFFLTISGGHIAEWVYLNRKMKIKVILNSGEAETRTSDIEPYLLAYLLSGIC